MQLYKKIDNNLLKKHPFHWIIGWHTFLPMILVMAIIGVITGYLYPTRMYNYSDDDGLEFISVFLGFISFMAFILYVVRQVKFNSFRIHHKIPFAKSIVIFFSFWLFTLLFSLVPFVPYQVHSLRVQSEIDIPNFDKDIETLYKGGVFFEAVIDKKDREKLQVLLNSNISNNDVVMEVTNYEGGAIATTSNKDYLAVYQEFDLLFGENEVSINRVSRNFGYYRYSSYKKSVDIFPKTISKKEAITYIENFIKVADKYAIKITERNPEIIYTNRKNFNRISSDYEYSLFMLHNEKVSARPYDRMMSEYKSHVNYNQIDDEVVLGILIFSILIATLLWVFISVPKSDFGYSILASVLLMILMAILTAIFSLGSSNDFEIRLLFYFAIIIIYLFAFNGDETRLKRIFKIVSHYLVVVILFLFFLEIEESNLYSGSEEFVIYSVMLLVGIIMSIFIFKQVYKNNRLLPK